ncbi:MAG TPA: VWA domain-containing protein [Anaerolineae bacterium]|nr:VWA domain-containing protein [Anaerolineae bacterium]
MGLLWPGFLLLLGVVPLLVATYVWVLRRRRRPAVRYSSLVLIREALPGQSRLRRHLPFALFLVALISLVVALARPVSIVAVPVGRATVMLAMDVSRSMCSIDVPPNRLETAKDAALSFIARQEAGTQIGLVAFAGYAELIQMPTGDQEILEDAVRSLITGRRTAVGSAILKALSAIAEIDPSVAPVVTPGPGSAPGVEPTPVPRGAYAPSIIVLLTDGASNQGPLPLDAAQEAADRGIRVYTIGYGTAEGGPMECGDGFSRGMYGDSPYGGGGGGGGGGFRRGIDEDTLIAVADMTGGEYYSAESADELQEVFHNLPTHLITRHETTEISVAFTAIGAVLAALALALAALWQPLP